jgi:hypothetical protein
MSKKHNCVELWGKEALWGVLESVKTVKINMVFDPHLA